MTQTLEAVLAWRESDSGYGAPYPYDAVQATAHIAVSAAIEGGTDCSAWRAAANALTAWAEALDALGEDPAFADDDLARLTRLAAEEAMRASAERLGLDDDEESPCVDRSRLPDRNGIGEPAEAWWSSLDYSPGNDRAWSHPICTFNEIDTLDGDTAVPEKFVQALAAGGERAKEARESIADLVAYGRLARQAALTIREYIDAAIDACERDDGEAMIEALEAASREEREWGDDPSTRRAASKLLAPGWSLDGGYVVRDEDA